MLTREQALDELIAIEKQLVELALRREDLRKIVLLQAGDPTQARRRFNHSSTQPRAAFGSAQEAVVRILREHGSALTASEIATLRGEGSTDNAIRMTLGSLLKKGVVNMVSNNPKRWELAIHTDNNTGNGNAANNL